jgi:hypothetical protein
VVKTVLVERDIEDGRRLLLTLDQINLPSGGFRVSAALWLFSGDPPEWRLIIATPSVDHLGFRSTYSAIQKVLDSLSPDTGLTLENISIVKPGDSLVRTLGRTLRVGQGGGVRFARNTVGDTYIEDSYIYKLSRAA